LKRLKVCRVNSPIGEIHIVLEESIASEKSECLADIDEIKEITRKEAAKPLVLFRKE
jgi:hypothetical protein